MSREKFQKPIDVVVKEANIKEEARQNLKKSQEITKERNTRWNKFYQIGE